METKEFFTPLLAFSGSLAIIGTTFSGKSSLLSKIIKYKKDLFTKEPQTVVYCYSEAVPAALLELDFVIPYRGLPDESTLEEWFLDHGPQGLLLCLDDLANEFYADKNSKNLISRMVHHNNVFLIVIAHSLFGQGKHSRFASLNFHSFLLTRSCRDLNQYATLGVQIWGPGKGRKFVQAFIDATELRGTQAGYLLVITHPLYTTRGMNCFTSIFPDDGPLILYK